MHEANATIIANTTTVGDIQVDTPKIIKEYISEKYGNLNTEFLSLCREHPGVSWQDIPEAVDKMNDIRNFALFSKKYFDIDVETKNTANKPLYDSYIGICMDSTKCIKFKAATIGEIKRYAQENNLTVTEIYGIFVNQIQ